MLTQSLDQKKKKTFTKTSPVETDRSSYTIPLQINDSLFFYFLFLFCLYLQSFSYLFKIHFWFNISYVLLKLQSLPVQVNFKRKKKNKIALKSLHFLLIPLLPTIFYLLDFAISKCITIQNALCTMWKLEQQQIGKKTIVNCQGC